ncbi:MAG TPA: leucine-rich repeat domain-containing protein [Oscillospiraceae bacterium]|nr:leucine-rich repeat domain-containing protein [Oscillospiraceae bacterium]HPF56462.1 leucine-rich repeat domain-containing protein [Clostridiales bacterium]HPK36271.1 leucine-rich repeat domain-containing protein [Oscillospiraceae bacterium]HPR75288.1 leucine-rich repeat domain-containing protein [Oscillospiraceae bacterium]
MKKFISLLLTGLLLCTGFVLSGCAVKGPELEQLQKDLKAAGYYDNMMPESIRAIEKDMYAQALELTAVKTDKSEKDDQNNTVYTCELTFESEILYIEAGYKITYTDGEITSVNRINTDRFVRLTVPDYVSEVESFTYQNNTDINELVVADGVTGLGASSFAGCTALKKVTIGGDVVMLATATFQGCTALESVTLTGGYPLAVLKDCFNGCTALKEITFSSELEFIGSYAFAGCAFTSLEFPDNVYQFSASCFSGCKNLKSVNITPSMKTIDPTAFEGCENLSKITVSPDNENFKMDGKNLVENAGGTVIFTLG